MITQNISEIPCVLLCGGKGTRLREVTEILPKPMVQIGDFPIVIHIMKWYASFGVKRFILCLGYKKEAFIQYFINYKNFTNDITIDFKDNTISVHGNEMIDWQVTLVDTGLESKTGRRVYRALKYINDSNMFFLTYGDGISNIDIKQLYDEHLRSNKNLTMSIVKNPSRFGLVKTDNNGNITLFKEKNQSDGYINGGFMVVNKQFIDLYLNDDDVFFEQIPFDKALSNNDIHAYKHNDFWQCMDNLKEYELLNNLWKSGNAKWKVK